MPAWTTMNDLATGDLVTEADMDAIRGNIEYLLDPNQERILRDNGGYYQTTSTSFVDVDATHLAATLVTHGGPVLVIVSASGTHSAAGGRLALDIAVDGTRLGGNYGLAEGAAPAANYRVNLSFAVLVTGLSAGSHTFKLQWLTSAATASLQADPTNNTPLQLSAIEL